MGVKSRYGTGAFIKNCVRQQPGPNAQTAMQTLRALRSKTRKISLQARMSRSEHKKERRRHKRASYWTKNVLTAAEPYHLD